MKTIKESFQENALMFIMVSTLVITCVGMGGKFSHNNNNDEFASYGYVPQYAMNIEQHDSVIVASNKINSTVARENSGYGTMSVQYAADTEQRALAFRDTARAISGNGESSYRTMSGQYAADVEQRALAFRDTARAITGSQEFSYGSISGQYAADAEQRTLGFRGSKKSIQW